MRIVRLGKRDVEFDANQENVTTNLKIYQIEDSSHLIEMKDNAALRERFDRDGFVYLKGYLHQVKEAREAVIEFLEGYYYYLFTITIIII